MCRISPDGLTDLSLSALLIIALNGLSYASTLFLVASGLTLIFGVTRIVNFAHGSFYMLGALLGAHWMVNWFPGGSVSALQYVLAMLAGTLCAALAGAVAEIGLLRRLYGVPELYQLVATFGLSLFMHDAMRWGLGPDEVFAPRFPGLTGAVAIGDSFFPSYQILTIVLGSLVWLSLHLLLKHTLFGTRVRAAAADAPMLAALGVNPQPVMLGVVVLGCALAGLGGVLQLPREPANLQMDMGILVETFAVVVTGGLGSIGGAMAAALLIGEMHAIGASLFPQATLVIVFLTMGLVLAFRPRGLFGKPQAQALRELAPAFVNAPASERAFVLAALGLPASGALAFMAGPYWQSLANDAFILVIFGVSLQAMMALGAMVSFGHAAFFGVGAYTAALTHLHWGWSLPAALSGAVVAALAFASLVGPAVTRSSGVYLAMLSLAFAQMLWAGANQWVVITGGDNGLIGLHLLSDGDALAFSLGVSLLAALSILGLRRLSRSSLGAALQAVRDAPVRAAASGLPVHRIRYRVFLLSATLAGLAGGLFAAHKGSVFTSVASVSTSVDVLLVVLLGGLHHVWGTLAGAAVLVWASAELGRSFEYWRGALGLLVMVIMVWAPRGLIGLRRGTGGRSA